MSSQFVFVLNIKMKHTFSLLFQMRISVLIELTVEHLRYHLTDVLP